MILNEYQKKARFISFRMMACVIESDPDQNSMLRRLTQNSKFRKVA